MYVHIASRKGRRDANEDCHKIFMNSDNSINKKYNTDKFKNVNIFCLYDGHGGDTVSNYLKDNMHLYFIDSDVYYPLNIEYITKICDKIQNDLKKKFYKKVLECGSTCIISIYYKKNNIKYIQTINIGDCRSIINSGNDIIQITNDHRPDSTEERKRISKLGGTIVNDGNDWRIKDLSVSRAFGDVNAEPYVVPKPDLYNYKMNGNEKYMVIACDGLWDYMSNLEVITFIEYNLIHNFKNKQKFNIADYLAEYAINTKKSYDNVSIIIIFFK